MTIQTVMGEVDLTIPPCTESGTVLKLQGKGITTPRGKTGDEYVTVNVKFPKNLSNEQKELIKKFSDLEEKRDNGVFSWLKRKFTSK